MTYIPPPSPTDGIVRCDGQLTAGCLISRKPGPANIHDPLSAVVPTQGWIVCVEAIDQVLPGSQVHLRDYCSSCAQERERRLRLLLQNENRQYRYQFWPFTS